MDHTRFGRDASSEASQRAASGSGMRGRSADVFEARGRVFMMVLMGIMAAVALRLVWFQIIRGPGLSQEAEKHRENVVKLHARRGTIYDRNGNVLAMSEECRTIYCNPKEIHEPYLTAEILAEHLGGTSNDYVGLLQQDATFVYVKRQISTKEADAILEELVSKDLPGIYAIQDSRRVYPFGAVGGQVLGIVGIDGDGISGLELYYNDLLSGTNGEMIVETGNGGTPIAGAVAKTRDAIDGTDIVISLDINVQRVAEEAIEEGVRQYKAESGSVMVTNPQTGEILATCSTPLLDASDLSVVEDGATSLKPVSDSYEPGSIFKVLTAAVGVDAGLMSSSSTFFVPAYVQVGSDFVSDDDDRYWDMNMSLREILRRSSNAGAALVAQDEIGADTFATGLESLGIGQLTGIDYPGEVPGIVKTRAEYDGSSVGSMAFGQGLAIPQVQMVRAVGAIAAGGVAYVPHFLVSRATTPEEWPEGEQVMSASTAQQVTDMMRTVVEEGTATKAQVPGYDVAGKTGTGERADTTKGGYIEDKFTSSLIGFAPAADARVLVYVGLNGTSHHAWDSAAPLFSSIMGEALTDMGVLPSS